MSPIEFSEWLEEHRSYRESKRLREWLTKLKRAERGEVVAEWMRTLKVISKSQALSATKRMHATGELESVAPDRHAARVLEVAQGLRDPGAERAREAKREKRLAEQKIARESVEERFGAELDALTPEEADLLAERAFEGNAFLRQFYRRKREGGENPRQSKLIREALLKELRGEEIRDPERTGRETGGSAESPPDFDQYRKSVFAGLGEMPDFKSNDQWDREG